MRRRIRLTTGLLCAAGLAAAGVLGTGWASPQAGAGRAAPATATATVSLAGKAPARPVSYSFAAAFAATMATPMVPPPGSNNFSCQPSAAHPYPVILVHGTVENMSDNWQAASPLLASRGYCVFAFNYGGTSPDPDLQGTGDIPASAGELAAFVSKVLAATGAGKVDIVGHSQGGMMPRYYLKFLDGAPRVHTLVGLAPSNHGTTIDGISTLSQDLALAGARDLVLGAACVSCTEQETGSAFLAQLSSGGDTVPGVHYTVIETRYDEVVTPYTSAFLTGPDVTNITVQNQCPLDLSDHLEISYDPVALADMLNALDPAHPVQVPCTTVLPLIGAAGLAGGTGSSWH
jgi:triacylglycerol esterase/lipase EstA (alpha/beta hydrolase family)